jgi:RluA family pseudouridine synthase
MSSTVIFKNSDILVVDKPPGVSVHNNEDPENLMDLMQKQLSLKKLFPVHRLDKETSGIQIFAINADAASVYSQLFQQNQVQKIYQGILRGQLKNSEPWNQSLTDKSEGRVNPAGVSKNRVPCLTEFKILQKNNYFTFCEFDLKTGRQHQIRKHSALSNHPIVGDSRYGDSKYNNKIFGIYNVNRMFLHCTQITINNQTFESPLPTEFHNIVAQIK